MNRKYGLMILPALGLAAPALSQNAKPNVILVLADDLGYGDMSCYGANRIETPAVDNLARTGVRFTNAHTVASTSTPSRYGLLTGEYPFRKANTNIAAGNACMIISPDQYTIADAFHNSGYRTGAFGKWHLGLGSKTGEQDWNGTLDEHPGDLGFDYSYIMAATADRVPCVFIENGKVVNYDSSAPIFVDYDRNFEGNDDYYTYTGQWKLRSSHGHDYSVVNGIGRIGYMKGGGKALWKDENIADSIASHAVSFIEENRNNPFFMYLCTNDIHVPRYPADRFRGKSPMGLRGDAILQFDWTIDTLVKTLERLGLRENTIIIVTSDNGPVLDDGYDDKAEQLAGDHKPGGGFRGGKYSSFEAGSIVPMIVSWPGHLEGGTVKNALVSQIDFLASFSSFLGRPVPSGKGVDSRDYSGTILGKDNTDARFSVAMSLNRSLVMRMGKWKYISPSEGVQYVPGPMIETGYNSNPQLYDMSSDPQEKRNVASQNPKVVSRMASMLKDLQEKR